MYSPVLLMNVLFFAFCVRSLSAWDYKDFAYWNIISPRCADQSHQSPRILTRASSVEHEMCHNLEWENNQPRDFNVVNNGHSLVFTPVISEDETEANTFIWGDHKWCLVQFHLHWSQNDHGAEHRLETFDNGLEVHFVHRRCDFPTLGDAVAEDTNLINTIAVIGVLYQVGQDQLMGQLINSQIINSKLVQGKETSMVMNFPYTQMLPDIGNRQFFTYHGSLTTPTCDPVLWFVVEAQQKVSHEEMVLLRTVLDHHGHVILSNQRPLQDNTQQLDFYEPCGEERRSDSDGGEKPGKKMGHGRKNRRNRGGSESYSNSRGKGRGKSNRNQGRGKSRRHRARRSSP